MAGLLPLGFLTFLDSNGDPLAGGTVTYDDPAAPGTPKAIWADSGQTIPAQNPLPLDAAGRPFSGGSEIGIYGTGQYRMTVRSTGGVLQWTALTAEPLSTTGGTVNGNFTINGLLTATNATITSNLSVNGVSTLQNVNIVSGTAQITNLVVTGNAQLNGSVGIVTGLNVTGPAFFSTLQTSGTITAGTDVIADGVVRGVGGVFASDPADTFGLHVTGNNRVFDITPQHFWTMDASIGSMEWHNPNGVTWEMRQSDNQSGNPTATVFGNGAYINSSDVRNKRDIRPARIGLPEILRLEPIDFVRMIGGRHDTGFSAQQVQEVIPVAVMQAGDTGLGVGDTAIVAALVNAVKALAARIVELEEHRHQGTLLKSPKDPEE